MLWQVVPCEVSRYSRDGAHARKSPVQNRSSQRTINQPASQATKPSNQATKQPTNRQTHQAACQPRPTKLDSAHRAAPRRRMATSGRKGPTWGSLAPPRRVCPEGWALGKATLRPTPMGMGYFLFSAPGIGPQVLVHGSMYQGSISTWCPCLTRSHIMIIQDSSNSSRMCVMVQHLMLSGPQRSWKLT